MNLLRALYSVVIGSRDAAPTTGTPQWATDGDPLTSTPSTILPSYWVNMITAELMAMIVNAGITPDDTDWGQVLKAVGGSYSLSNPGFLCLPGLFILNFGNQPVASGVTDTLGGTGYAKTFNGPALPPLSWSNPGGISNSGILPAVLNVRDTGNGATLAVGKITNPTANGLVSFDWAVLGR